MNKTVIASFFALLCIVSTQAFAHKRWLLPSDFALSDQESVAVDFSASNNIFYVDSGMPLEAVKVHTPGGEAQAIENPVQGKRRSSFDVDITEQGTYRIYTAGKPFYFVSYQVPGETETLRGRGPLQKLKGELPKDAYNVKFMELHSLIETYVSLGDYSTAVVPAALDKVLRLEFLTHPNELYSDEAGRFRLLFQGKPLSNTKVMLIPEGTRYRNDQGEIVVTTDDKGELSVQWPASGRYLLTTSHSEEQSGGDIAVRRFDYFVTFEVLLP